MPVDLDDLLRPGRTALVTQECQRGAIGDRAIWPDLVRAAADTVLPNGVRLLAAARTAGVHVVHCLKARRADGLGQNTNAPLFAVVRKAEGLVLGTQAAELVPEFGPEDDDIVLTRLHGVSPMSGTGLDPILRNLGVRTIVAVGVSVNVAITNLAMDAVNLGFRFVLPRDAVAGAPPEYAEAVVEHTLRMLGKITTTDEIVACWS